MSKPTANVHNLPGLNDIDPGDREAIIGRAGGEELARYREAARSLQDALRERISGEEARIFGRYCDAASDFAGTHEDAAIRVSFAQGVGVGAAWARFPELDREAVAKVAQAVQLAVMATDLPEGVAQEVAALVLSLLAQRAEGT